MVTAVILWMLPVSEAVYDFRTELREDEFTSPTADGAAANVTLSKPIYDDDTGTLDFFSDLATDTPAYNTWDNTTQVVNITGLTANTTRILLVSYDVNALEGYDAIGIVVDRFPFIWILLIIVFPIGAFAAMFMGRAN